MTSKTIARKLKDSKLRVQEHMIKSKLKSRKLVQLSISLLLYLVIKILQEQVPTVSHLARVPDLRSKEEPKVRLTKDLQVEYLVARRGPKPLSQLQKAGTRKI